MQYQAQRRQIGELNCIVIRPAADVPIRALCVFCHGYGAPGDDLAGLAGEILESRTGEEPVMLVFPAALLSLASEGYGDGRAWWHLSIQRLISAMEAGHYETIRVESPEGIDEARIALTGTIRILLSELDLDEKSLLLGGFSQGAMLSMECATLGLEEPPAALVLYSGCLIREKQWRSGMAKLAGTKILQSHGTQDMILPLRTGLWLRDELTEHGCQVEFIQFAGPHTICMEAIERTSQWIDEVAARTTGD